MWRNFSFPCMTIVGKLKISLHVEKSEILHIWHVFDVENVAIYAKFMHFIAIYVVLLLNLLFTLFCHELYFATIYALSRGEKLSPKVNFWRKNDKHQVWEEVNNCTCSLSIFGRLSTVSNLCGGVTSITIIFFSPRN